MALYALSDTHLSLVSNKPMDIFGERWKNHTERLKYFWETQVLNEDTVVIPGDISWAMTLEEALPDLSFLNALPGRKIIGKGNHDFWWSTAAKIKKKFEEEKLDSLFLLHNNAYAVDSYAVCGSRGWFTEGTCPKNTNYRKIVTREAGRLAASLDEGRKLGKDELLVFLHFPPVLGDFVCRELIEILHRYDVKHCYYGHMHGQYNIPKRFSFEGIEFTIIAADHLQFQPFPIDLKGTFSAHNK